MRYHIYDVLSRIIYTIMTFFVESAYKKKRLAKSFYKSADYSGGKYMFLLKKQRIGIRGFGNE